MCFNGATAMKPWKTECRNDSETVRELQWGHGDEAVEDKSERPRRRSHDRFNGATAMKPWKTCSNAAARHRATTMLQWGHGDEAVEDGPRAMVPSE